MGAHFHSGSTQSWSDLGVTLVRNQQNDEALKMFIAGLHLGGASPLPHAQYRMLFDNIVETMPHVFDDPVVRAALGESAGTRALLFMMIQHGRANMHPSMPHLSELPILYRIFPRGEGLQQAADKVLRQITARERSQEYVIEWNVHGLENMGKYLLRLYCAQSTIVL